MGLSCTGLRLLRTPSRSNPGVSNCLKNGENRGRVKDDSLLQALCTGTTAHEVLIAFFTPDAAVTPDQAKYHMTT